MNIDNFNQLLSTISKTYEETLNLRQQLQTCSNEEITESLEKRCKQGKSEGGWVSREILLEWVNDLKEKEGKISKRQFTLDEMKEIFPFEKVSHTVLLATCLKKTLDPVQRSIKNILTNCTNHAHLLTKILSNELQTNYLRKQIVPLIELYIPLSSNNLTPEELKDYLLLGHSNNRKNLQIDPTYVIMALNGSSESGQKLEFDMYKRDLSGKQNCVKKQETGKNNSGIDRIKEIMNRLNKRIDNFGNEWLINRLEIPKEE